MKYAVLNTDTLQNKRSEGETNVGAIYMTRAVENIYANLGIDKDSLMEIKTCELSDYDGEPILLPICIHIPRAYESNELFYLSKKIVPIFLSISMTETELGEKHISFFKKYEPIGCRDSQTFHTMQKYGIDSYLAGCLVATFSNRGKRVAKKILFSDVPKFAEKYIPQEMKKDISFIKQELLLSELPKGVEPKEYATYIFEEYRDNARLVVSSRFHAAVLALALGIPFILINETYTYRFSWLKGKPNYYTKENIASINWEPQPIDFSREKELMIRIAQYRICENTRKLEEKEYLFEPKIVWQEEITKEEFDQNREELYTLLEDKEWKNTGQIDYCEGAFSYMEKNWNSEYPVRYAIWGVNNNANLIYHHIQKNFPCAKLSHVYDINMNAEFNGMNVLSPDSIKKSDEEYVFVTTFVAKDPALLLFRKKDITKFFICEREYINSFVNE